MTQPLGRLPTAPSQATLPHRRVFQSLSGEFSTSASVSERLRPKRKHRKEKRRKRSCAGWPRRTGARKWAGVCFRGGWRPRGPGAGGTSRVPAPRAAARHRDPAMSSPDATPPPGEYRPGPAAPPRCARVRLGSAWGSRPLAFSPRGARGVSGPELASLRVPRRRPVTAGRAARRQQVPVRPVPPPRPAGAGLWGTTPLTLTPRGFVKTAAYFCLFLCLLF